MNSDRPFGMSCPGSVVIAESMIAQCNDDADVAAVVLLLAAAIAGLKAGQNSGEMAAVFLRTFRAAESLTGIQRKAPH